MKNNKAGKPLNALCLYTLLTAAYAFFVHPEYVFAKGTCSQVFVANSGPVTSKLMKNLEMSVAADIPTSGYKDYNAYIEALKRDPNMRLAWSEIESMQNLKVAIRVREKSLIKILVSEEVKNQFQTGASDFILNPAWRKLIESTFVGLTKRQYEKIPDEVRPKYGYLAGDPHGSYRDPHELSALDIVLILKTKNLEDRMTITKVDSLSLGLSPEPAWENHFTPWKYRGLMVPFFAKRLREEGRVVSNFFLSREDKINGQDSFKGHQPVGNNSYLEVQVWGALHTDSIQSIVFTNKQPGPIMRKKLEQLGIEVIDGRGLPAYQQVSTDRG